MDGWGWFAMTASAVLVLGLVAVGVMPLARVGQQPSQRFAPPPPGSAEHLLAERHARGEIDEQEYRRRLATLSDSGPRTP